MNKTIANVRVGNIVLDVEYWDELLDQWGADGLKDYLYAEALKQLGETQDAVNFLSAKASGTLTQNESGGWVDTRNWQQNWIDSYGK